MANIRFLGPTNLWSTATGTVSALSASTALPASYSANPDRTLVYRSLSQTAGQWLKIDLGASQAVTCCALANVKLQNAGSVKLQYSDDNSSWSDVGTFPAADALSQVTYLFFASISHRYWRLLWVNGSGAADTAEVGYVFLGTYVEPSINVSAPMDSGRTDPSIVTLSVDGQKTRTVRTAFGYWNCRFDAAPEADLTALKTFFAAVGVRVPFFLVLDTTLAWTAWFCAFTSEMSHDFSDIPGQYDIAFKCEEER